MKAFNVKIALAYFGVIIIWSSTPTAIKWSSHGLDQYSSLLARVGLATLFVLLFAIIFQKKPQWNRPALLHYLSANIGATGSLLLVYIASEYVPPGIISVLFGLSPILTGLLSQAWLKENKIAHHEWFAFLLGLSGLGIIFIEQIFQKNVSLFGFIMLFCSVLAHAASSVFVKKYPLNVHPLSSVSGTLVMSLPVISIVSLVHHDQFFFKPDTTALLSILYLSLFGSVLALFCFFYLLKNLKATTVNLATLITPVLGLIFSVVLNHDSFGANIYLGTGLILSALSLYLYGHKIIKSR